MTDRPLPPGFPNLKPGPVECGCKCGLVGMPRARPWRNGQTCVKRCKCNRCEGRRHGKRAYSRERSLAKDTGGRRTYGSGRGGGPDTSGLVDCEETSQETIVRGARAWWRGKGVQAKTAALYSRRIVPRAFVLSWSDTEDGPRRKQLVIMEYDDFKWVMDNLKKAEAEKCRCSP